MTPRVPALRVLVADDSSFVRACIESTLAPLPHVQLRVVPDGGAAAIALNESWDLVLLDIVMPGRDGVDLAVLALKEHRAKNVVVMSALPEESAARAIAEGADFLPKPQLQGDWSAFQAALTELAGAANGDSPTPEAAAPTPAKPEQQATTHRFRRTRPEAVVVGCSTGGPEALDKFLAGLELPVPVLVVQHVLAGHDHRQQQRMAAGYKRNVALGEDGMEATADTIIMAPAGHHMRLVREKGKLIVRLDEGPEVNFCRPAVDPLFQSAADTLGPQALGVILTGMGKDGALGSLAISTAGGRVLVQDEASSVVWGMPRAALESGADAEEVSLDRMSARVRSAFL